MATSLGLGAQQATSGINHLFGTSGGVGMQIVVIIGVTTIAVTSVVRGIDGGVKLLSNVNMLIALALVVFVALVGFSRVSRGRTIRQFITAILIIPTLVTVVWMSVFGGLAIDQVVNKVGALGTKGLTEVPLAMFQMFEMLPMGTLLSLVAIILVLVFFITSSDSGSLVIDSITAGGKLDAPVPQRIFWASIEGAVAAVLLWVGGTEAIPALQAGAISSALPFTIVLLFMCVSLLMGLRTEPRAIK